MSLIDSHCHLDDEQFNADREETIDRALAAGVDRMVVIGTGDGPPDLEAGIRLADPSTHRVMVRAQVKDPRNELRPGMLATVVVRFAGPIDPTTFVTGDVHLVYRDTSTAATQPGTDISTAVTSVVGINTDALPTLAIGSSVARDVDGSITFTIDEGTRYRFGKVEIV